MTEEYRQKLERKLGFVRFSIDEISDAAEWLVKEGEVEKQIIGGEPVYRYKKQVRA